MAVPCSLPIAQAGLADVTRDPAKKQAPARKPGRGLTDSSGPNPRRQARIGRNAGVS